MFKFFVDQSQISENSIMILGSDVNHIVNVIRLQVQDGVTISDGEGHEYVCVIQSMTTEEVILEIVERLESNNELKTKLYLFQGLPKKDKLEWIIQKSVELGVYEVTPVLMKRSIVKLDDKAKVKKQVRWQSIAVSAAKQSKRSIEPKVHIAHSFKESLKLLSEMDLILVAYESAKGIKYTREILSEVSTYDKIGIVIGPEGGFDDAEIEQLKEVDAKIISLGRRILRTETAGLTLLSCLMLELEEDNHAS